MSLAELSQGVGVGAWCGAIQPERAHFFYGSVFSEGYDAAATPEAEDTGQRVDNPCRRRLAIGTSGARWSNSSGTTTRGMLFGVKRSVLGFALTASVGTACDDQRRRQETCPHRGRHRVIEVVRGDLTQQLPKNRQLQWQIVRSS